MQGSASPEVDYLWKVLLNNLNTDVAAGAQEMVGSYYAQTTESQHEFIRFVSMLELLCLVGAGLVCCKFWVALVQMGLCDMHQLSKSVHSL